jgi:hypothetical protein
MDWGLLFWMALAHSRPLAVKFALKSLDRLFFAHIAPPDGAA